VSRTSERLKKVQGTLLLQLLLGAFCYPVPQTVLI